MEGSPIVTNNTNISPDFFPGRFFLLPPKHAQFGHAGGKSQIASKCLWGSDFFGQDKERPEEKVDLFTAENDLFVCGDAGEVFCPHLHCDSVSLGRSLGSMIPLLAAYRYT